MSTPMDDAAEKVAQSCLVMGKLDLTHAALGHVSLRVGDTDEILIKSKGPTESGLRFTTEADIVRIGLDAEKISGLDDKWPPGESYIHTWLYKLRPEIRSVIHVHPEHAVLLTICGKEIFPIYGAYWPPATQLATDGVRTYPSSVLINDDRIGEEFARFVADNDAVLMYGHGITVVGTSLEEASMRAISLNQLVTMMYKAYAIGQPRRLPDEEVALLTRPRDSSEMKGSAAGNAGVLANWRYYVQLAGETPLV